MSRPRTDEILPDHCAKDVVVLCCGNVLFGDDGFGPAVAARLHETVSVPEWAVVIDAGTGVRELLFDMALSERRPKQVVVVDAVDLNDFQIGGGVDGVNTVDLRDDESGLARTAGDVFEIPLDRIPRAQASEFSVHQAPTSNLLQELAEVGGVRVAVIVCQVESIPEEMTEAMSPAVAAAADRAAAMIADRFLREPAGAMKP